MENPVPMNIRRKRNEMLRILSEKKRRHFYQQHIGQTRSVLLEGTVIDGQMVGFTDNYIKVLIDFDENLVNSICKVKLENLRPDGLVKGKLVNVGKEFLAI